MKTWFVASILVLVLSFSPVFAAAPLPDKDAEVDFGVPLWASSPMSAMIMEIYEKSAIDPSKLVKREVNVTNLPAFVFMFAPAPDLVAMINESLWNRADLSVTAVTIVGSMMAQHPSSWFDAPQ